MKKKSWTTRDPIKNYFPLPNEIYQLGLSPGAIAVYRSASTRALFSPKSAGTKF